MEGESVVHDETTEVGGELVQERDDAMLCATHPCLSCCWLVIQRGRWRIEATTRTCAGEQDGDMAWITDRLVWSV